MFLEISQNSQESTCGRISFLIKLQAEACNLIKKETLAQVFSWNFAKFLSTSFRQNTSRQQLQIFWWYLDFRLACLILKVFYWSFANKKGPTRIYKIILSVLIKRCTKITWFWKAQLHEPIDLQHQSVQFWSRFLIAFLANNYLFKVHNRNSRKRCKMSITSFCCFYC